MVPGAGEETASGAPTTPAPAASEAATGEAAAATSDAARQKLGRLLIGCAGFQNDEWRDGAFYPKHLPRKEEVGYYMRRFNTTEINTTYHGLPRHATYEKWYQQAPRGFQYTLKVPKALTHINLLQEAQDTMDRMLPGARLLKDKIGILLFQLPPSFKLDLASLEAVADAVPPEIRCAWDLRHPSWFVEPVFELMRRRGWAVVVSSQLNVTPVFQPTGPYMYVRFHGPTDLHASEYSLQEMQQWAERLSEWRAQGRDVYAYFLNDYQGMGPRNAHQLGQAMRKLAGEPEPKMPSGVMGMPTIASMFAKQASRKRSDPPAAPAAADAADAAPRKRLAASSEDSALPRKAMAPAGQATSIASFFAPIQRKEKPE